MENLKALFNIPFQVMKLEINVLGYTVSFFQLFIFSTVGGLLMKFVGGVIGGRNE